MAERKFGLAAGAYWLDRELRRRFGLYRLALTAALVVSIGATIASVQSAITSTGDLVKIAAIVGFQVLLLINQLAQLHQSRLEREEHRAAKKARKASSPVVIPAEAEGAEPGPPTSLSQQGPE